MPSSLSLPRFEIPVHLATAFCMFEPRAQGSNGSWVRVRATQGPSEIGKRTRNAERERETGNERGRGGTGTGTERRTLPLRRSTLSRGGRGALLMLSGCSFWWRAPPGSRSAQSHGHRLRQEQHGTPCGADHYLARSQFLRDPRSPSKSPEHVNDT